MLKFENIKVQNLKYSKSEVQTKGDEAHCFLTNFSFPDLWPLNNLFTMATLQEVHGQVQRNNRFLCLKI